MDDASNSKSGESGARLGGEHVDASASDAALFGATANTVLVDDARRRDRR